MNLNTALQMQFKRTFNFLELEFSKNAIAPPSVPVPKNSTISLGYIWRTVLNDHLEKPFSYVLEKELGL